MQPGDIFEVSGTNLSSKAFFLIQEVKEETVSGYFINWNDKIFFYPYWEMKGEKLKGAIKDEVFNRFIDVIEKRLGSLKRETQLFEHYLSKVNNLK